MLLLLHIVAAFPGCGPIKDISSMEEVPAIYFELGTANYAQDFHYLENESALPDSIYVYEKFKNIIAGRPLGSITLLPFLDTTEDISLSLRRIAKVKRDFINIGVDSTQITVLHGHCRANPVSEETITDLPSLKEQRLARSLNSRIGIILQAEHPR